MKKYDLVKLNTNNKEFKSYNIYPFAKGIIVEIIDNIATVMFFNEHNQGDYACLKVAIKDLELLQEKSTPEVVNFFKNNFANFNMKEKCLKKKEFNIFDNVELMVEDTKYSKYGVHKGYKGVIMEDFAVKDYVLVDFGQLDKNNNYIGDCISVNLKDLKILKNV